MLATTLPGPATKPTICDIHPYCYTTTEPIADKRGRIGTRTTHAFYTPTTIVNLVPVDAEPLPDHRVVFDGGDDLDRFVIRCACGYESAYFSYIAAARSMDAHVGDTFIPVAVRPVGMED